MASDAELDRLKAIKKAALRLKLDTEDRQDGVEKKVCAAKEVLKKAYQQKEDASTDLSIAQRVLENVRSVNEPVIEELDCQHECSFQSMRLAYDNATSARYRNVATISSKEFVKQGNDHKAHCQQYADERRTLVGEITAASEHLRETKQKFEHAKSAFVNAKNIYDHARFEYSRARAAFKDAADHYNEAVISYEKRDEILSNESKRHTAKKREIAEKAGVSRQYLDNVYITYKPDGAHVYFGGVGKPNGPGHGHYVITQDGSVVRKRDPFGSLANPNRDYFEVVASEINDDWDFGFNCSFKGHSAFVESSLDSAKNRRKINIYYGKSGPFGPGHNRAVAYPEDPHEIILDEVSGM